MSEKSNTSEDSVNLKFNAVGITSDNNRASSTLKGGVSVPLEILPQKLVFGGVEYSFSADEKNCLVCDGGEINVEDGCKSVHLLLTSLGGNKKVSFGNTEVTVPDCFEKLGHWDLMRSGETGYIKSVPQALTLTHTHSKNGNLTAKQFYIFHAEIPLNGESSIRLPDDEDIVIFAATAVKESTVFLKGDEHFDSLEKRSFDYEFSDYAVRHMNPNKAERVLDKFFDRDFVLNVKAGEFYNKYSLGELYFILRQIHDRMNLKKDAIIFTEKR